MAIFDFPSLPVAPARTDDDGDQAEREIDRHENSDLLEVPPRAREIAGGEGAAKTLPRRGEEVEKEEHHDDAGGLHGMDMGANAGEAAEAKKHHAIAARQQRDHAGPDPGKEAAEDTVPERQAQGRLERSSTRPQRHIGEEHAADPDHRSEYMDSEAQDHDPLLRLLAARPGTRIPPRLRSTTPTPSGHRSGRCGDRRSAYRRSHGKARRHGRADLARRLRRQKPEDGNRSRCPWRGGRGSAARRGAASYGL